jgi:hypothetical protein
MSPLVAKARILSHIGACRPPMCYCCVGLLLDDRSIYKPHAEFIGHSSVLEFVRLLEEFQKLAPDLIADLQDEVKELWLDAKQPALAVMRTAPIEFSRREDTNAEDSLIVRRANYLIGTGILTDVAAIQVACLIIEEKEGRPEIKTSELTALLRKTNYRIPNPATTVRSLATRAEPIMEVLEERVGARQELQFRLLPEAANDLRQRLLDGLIESAA